MTQLTVFVRCLRNVQSGRKLHAPGVELDLPERDAAELVQLGAVEVIEQPRKVPGLLGVDHLPALVVIGDQQFTAGDIVRQSFDESGLDPDGWNELPTHHRQGYVDSVIAGLQPTQYNPKREAVETAQPAAAAREEASSKSPDPAGAAPAWLGAGVSSLSRADLDVALGQLPGDHTDADYVVNSMRSHFGELFTDGDEAQVRAVIITTKTEATAIASGAAQAAAPRSARPKK